MLRSDSLCYLQASEALRCFRTGALSPLELMRAVIARAEAVEPQVNALCMTHFERALEHAGRAERAYRAGTARALEGLPVAVKDEAYIEGQITTNGSLLLEHFVAPHTDPVAQRLLDAGAIVHARTATPEFSMAGVTWSTLWGITRNPWNLAVTPGGSSGGSAAALASGTATLATGSDIAGSIRIPAAMSGVVGFKPPYGRVPQSPPWNLDTYCHEGPLARSVADCVLMQNVIAGPHPRDMVSLAPKLVLPERYEGIAGMRIAYSVDLGYFEVDEPVRANLVQALEVLTSLGAKVRQVALPWDPRCKRTALTHLSSLCGTLILREFGAASTRARLTSYIRQFLEGVEAVTSRDVVRALEHANAMYAQLAAVLADHEALICPTVATTDIAADYDPTALERGGVSGPSRPQLDLFMTYPFNTLSRCPVLAVPTGKAANGVPTGMQIVARPYDDPTVFRIGMAYEAAHPLFWHASDLPAFA